MAQNPVAVIASIEDVVVLPDASHIVITLGVGGPKVDLALEPDLALNMVDACAKAMRNFSVSRKCRKKRALSFPLSGSKWARMKSGAS